MEAYAINYEEVWLHKVFNKLLVDMLDSNMHKYCQRTRKIEVLYDSTVWCREKFKNYNNILTKERIVNTLMSIFYKLMLVVISPCFRGSEDLLPGWEGVMVDTVFSMCHALWPGLIIVSLVKALVRKIMDWISIWDWYSLRICIRDKNSLEDQYSKDGYPR